MTEGIQVKTHEAYIESLRKTISPSFKVHEVARFSTLSGEMTKDRKKVFAMFSSTNDMLTRQQAKRNKNFKNK